MRRSRPNLLLGTIAIALVSVSCSEGGRPVAPMPADLGSPTASAARNDISAAARDGIADVDFGRDNVGSGHPGPSGHDRSFHATDKIVPRAIVIPVGGTVRLNTGSFHQAAIYDVGTTAEDIALSPETLDDLPVPFPPFVLADFLINDPTNRLALSPFFPEPTTWTAPAVFDRPGTYLIICTVLPHFAGAKMYAYVIVK